MALEIRPYREEDLAGMIKVWNEVVEAGEAFPQVEPLTMETARAFFAEIGRASCRERVFRAV